MLLLPSLTMKKPAPLMAASSERPVFSRPPDRPMFCVCEPMLTPVGWSPATSDEKFARDDL